MKLIVGLGNPEKKYLHTRHNVGWMILDKLKNTLCETENWKNDFKFEAELCVIPFPEKILLVRPQTYMNNSGRSVRRLVDFYKIKHEDIIIVHDELDVAFGMVRIRYGGSEAGHKGVRSIIHHLGDENFWRVRVGIGNSQNNKVQEAKDFVLEQFSALEKKDIKIIIDSTVEFLIKSLEQNNLKEITFSGR